MSREIRIRLAERYQGEEILSVSRSVCPKCKAAHNSKVEAKSYAVWREREGERERKEWVERNFRH